MTVKTPPLPVPNLDASKTLFIQEVIRQRDELQELLLKKDASFKPDDAAKILHRIKGGVGFFTLDKLDKSVSVLLAMCRSIDASRPIDRKAIQDCFELFSAQVDELIVAP